MCTSIQVGKGRELRGNGATGKKFGQVVKIARSVCYSCVRLVDQADHDENRAAAPDFEEDSERALTPDRPNRRIGMPSASQPQDVEPLSATSAALGPDQEKAPNESSAPERRDGRAFMAPHREPSRREQKCIELNGATSAHKGVP